MKKQADKLNLKFTNLLRDTNKCYLPFLIRRLSSLRAQISYQANRRTLPFLTVKNTDVQVPFVPICCGQGDMKIILVLKNLCQYLKIDLNQPRKGDYDELPSVQRD